MSESHTPESSGETRQLEFLADGTVRQFLDEELVGTGVYDWSLYDGNCQSSAYLCDSDEAWTLPIGILPHPYYFDQEICTYNHSDIIHLSIIDHCVWDAYNHLYEPRDSILNPIATEKTGWGVLKSVYRARD